MKDLKELKELCEKATPGPWEKNGITITFDEGVTYRYISYEIMGLENAEFIAAANPQTVLSLIERVEGLEKTRVIETHFDI